MEKFIVFQDRACDCRNDPYVFGLSELSEHNVHTVEDLLGYIESTYNIRVSTPSPDSEHYCSYIGVLNQGSYDDPCEIYWWGETYPNMKKRCLDGRYLSTSRKKLEDLSYEEITDIGDEPVELTHLTIDGCYF